MPDNDKTTTSVTITVCDDCNKETREDKDECECGGSTHKELTTEQVCEEKGIK